MNSFYTYSHMKPDGSVFYIGKGLGQRHLASDNRNIHWHRTVKKYGYESKILAYWDTEEDAFEHERFLIACFRDLGAKLVNMTNGGEGSGGYKWSDEQRAKWTAVMKERGNPMLGKKHSLETRDKIRQRAIGRKSSDQTREKISAAMKNRVFSDAHLQNLSKASAGGGNAMARRCVVDGIEYACAVDAAKALGICKSTVCRRCVNPAYPTYQYI